MSSASVVTRGFGTFGSVNLLPTLGYSSLNVVPVGPGRCAAGNVYVPGASFGAVYVPGANEGNVFVPGSTGKNY